MSVNNFKSCSNILISVVVDFTNDFSNPPILKCFFKVLKVIQCCWKYTVYWRAAKFDNATPDLSERQSGSSVRFTSWFNPLPTPPHSYSIWWCRAICVFQVMSSVQQYSTSSSSITSADSQSVIVVTVFVLYCCTSTVVVQCSSTFYKPFICQCLTYYFDSILCNDRLMTVLQ